MVWMRFSRSNPPRNSAMILLVDDNRDGVLARQSVLEELGYQVVPAHCGADALQWVEKQIFDLVITDYKMWPMDGLELIAELRRREFANPIILLSGFVESIGLRPENTGADSVIQKSANEISTLLRQTNRFLNPKKPAASSRTKLRARSAGQS
ncbi:MAG: response regulator receiver protein [Bryobacterales bacterium]|nr:response regulator receiver protein [Bryobacterales bacterium]